jgi:uncharacterized lipoprotein
MKRSWLALSALACLLSTGCALTTDRVALEYRPMAGVQPIPAAQGITVSVTVIDMRTEKTTKVSAKKNGFGMEMAPILAEEDPTLTLKKAIETELTARGFTLSGDAMVAIKSELVRFWNDHKTGFFAADAVADLNMTVTVKDKTGEKILFTKQINVQGVEANNQVQGGNNAKLALDKALANGVKQLFDDAAFVEAVLKAKG